MKISLSGSNITSDVLNAINQNSIVEGYVQSGGAFNGWSAFITICPVSNMVREQFQFCQSGLAVRHWENSWGAWKKVSLS